MSDEATSAQMRAARSMLGWRLTDLAKAARVSVAAVMRAEGHSADGASDAAKDALRKALEAGGIEFSADADGTGVRLRTLQTSVFSRFL